MSSPAYLIVEQQEQAPPALPSLLQELAQKHQLDAYQCRQRLIGRGLALLGKGAPAKLEKVSASLTVAGYQHWIVAPTQPDFAPQRIRGLQISDSEILFQCSHQQLSFPAGGSVLAILADLSGSLKEQSVKQLLSSHAYRGRDQVRNLSDEKVISTILRGVPVLDLYLLDDDQKISAAVRALPGKFDPQGLGERATLSSRQNLLQVMELARETAGDFTLHTDFGLVNLPGCQLRSDTDSQETQRQNLISLARYGWLMGDLLHSRARGEPTAAATAPDMATATAPLSLNPAPASDPESAQAQPITATLQQEINPQGQTQPAAAAAPEPGPDRGLPAPPEPSSSSPWRNPGFWFGSGGAAVVILLILLDSSLDGNLVRALIQPAFRSGLLPFVAAILLFCYGFYFLRMKREMENTPTSRVRSIAMGMVEVKGQALRTYALVSPMSHTPCVYYRLTKYRRDRNDHWRVSSISSSANVKFELEDATGRVEINPSGCRVSAGTKQEGTPGQVGLLHLDRDSDDKWVEEVIVEGSLLYVLGYASVKRPTGPTRAERRAEALRKLKRNPQAMQRFDRDGDGHISTEEWDDARAAVEDQLLRESLSAGKKRKKQEEHVVIGKRKGHPLIISETHSENQLTQRYLYYSIPLLLASVAAIGGAIYQLLNFLG